MKIGMLGCGKIGKTLLKEIRDHEYGEVIFVQDPAAEESVVSACAPGAKLIREPEDDCYAQADLVIECATSAALKPNLERILKQSDLFLFSVTSFADPQFEADARALTAKYGTHIYIPHGAILGLDGILDGRSDWESITIETTKNPASLGRDDQEYTVLYEGPTREACSLYPRNVNVHAAVAMAGIGFEKTHSKIISDPSVHTNTHVISVKGPGMDIQIRVSSFSEGGVTGKYTPLSDCGRLHRLLDTKDAIKII